MSHSLIIHRLMCVLSLPLSSASSLERVRWVLTALLLNIVRKLMHVPRKFMNLLLTSLSSIHVLLVEKCQSLNVCVYRSSQGSLVLVIPVSDLPEVLLQL